jgi:chromosomal replication initiator protein DnaA
MNQDMMTYRLNGLPEFLRVSVEKGLVDEATARRIELYRRTRTTAEPEEIFDVLDMKPDPEMTFAAYVPCRGNAFALELAKIVASNVPKKVPYNPICIYSDVGIGKTHLLSAIANEAKGRSALLVNTVDLAADFEKARKNSKDSSLRQWLGSMDILLIDDIQLCEGDERLQIDLFSILNHMITDGRWVVISSDAYPTRLVGLESRLISRLRGGVIVGLQMPDEAERLEILLHLTQDCPLPHDVLAYVAANVNESIRQLKATVAQLKLLASSCNSRITPDVARMAIYPTEMSAPAPVLNSESPQAPAASDADDRSRPILAADRFKKMLATAETEAEQVLALQIALGERIRQLRNSDCDGASIAKLENALTMLRDGNMEEAVKCLGP